MVFSRGTALIFFAAMGKPKGEEDWHAVDLIRFAIKSDVNAISVMGRWVLSVLRPRRRIAMLPTSAARSCLQVPPLRDEGRVGA
jgi:hypothetical protein